MSLTRRKHSSILVGETIDQEEEKLDKLFAIKHKPLSTLTTEECSLLDDVRKTARHLYSSSQKNYEQFFNEIVKRSIQEESSPPKAHTVGAFLTGCLAETNIMNAVDGVNKGCSLLCYDSLPTPKWGFCSQSVILCVTNNSEFAKVVRSYGNKTFLRGPLIPINTTDEHAFEFIMLTNVSSSSRAILFVDFLTYNDFPGFTRREKGFLMYRMHINNVKLLSYDKENASEYKDLLEGKVLRVHELKSRPEIVEQPLISTPIEPSAMMSGKKQVVSTLRSDDQQPLSWSQATILFIALSLLAIIIIFSLGFLKRKNV